MVWKMLSIYCPPPEGGLLCRRSLISMFVRRLSVCPSVSRSFLSAQAHFKKLNHFLGQLNRLKGGSLSNLLRIRIYWKPMVLQQNRSTDWNSGIASVQKLCQDGILYLCFILWFFRSHLPVPNELFVTEIIICHVQKMKITSKVLVLTENTCKTFLIFLQSTNIMEGEWILQRGEF